MPLRNNTLYTVHNDLTHTVLDMSDQHVARGWGWHGKPGQQWKLIQGDNDNQWKLQNQRNARYLSRVADQVNDRLTGVGPDDVADATFVIQEIASDRYRIIHEADGVDFAVTLATGGPDNAHNIAEGNQIPDLHANGPPIVLETEVAAAAPDATPEQKIETENRQRAQIWSFRPVAELPLADGTYQIVNSRTGTVLGVAGNAPLLAPGAEFDPNDAPNAIQGQQSQADQPNQKWIVTKDSDSDSYTFKSRQGGIDRFLGTAIDPPPPGPLRALGDGNKREFTIRKAPDTNYYKIFLVPNDHHVSPLAVNIGDATAVILEADEAQKWSFI